MNESKIINYRHTPGGNCFSVAWSGIISHAGKKLSECDVFGLSGGLFFGFFAISALKQFNISLNSPNMLQSLFTNLGLSVKPIYFPDDESAHEFLINKLEADFPVAVELNPNFFEYLVRQTPEEIISDLPPHWVVIIGFNHQRNSYIIFDNRQFNEIEIPLSKFQLARNSGAYAQNPRNAVYFLNSETETFPFEVSVKLSLSQVIQMFKQVKKYAAVYAGSYGYEKIIRQIKLWNLMLNEEQLIENIKRIRMSITGAGGVKGGYRMLYFRYLEDIANVLGNELLLEAADCFRNAAKNWVLFYDYLSELEKSPYGKNIWGENSILSHNLNAIYNHELNGIELMEKCMSEKLVSGKIRYNI